MYSNKLKYSLLTILVAGLIVLYGTVNPATNPFPKCPFKQFTGYQCPGCGSQRAVHQLLHFEIAEAFQLNPLLILSIPYVVIGLAFEHISLNDRWLSIRKTLFGPHAIKVIIAIVFAFWLLRNL